MARDAIQVAVDRLAGRLQRSVVINDAAVHLLYASAHFGDEDPVRIRAVLQREADSKVIGHVLAQGVSTWTMAGVIPPDPALQMKARVCVPVRWHGELLGLLMVMDADGSLTTAELTMISDTAQDLAPLILPQVRDDRQAAADERTVVDLLGRNPLLRRQALAELGTRRDAARFGTVTVIELAVRGATDEPVATHADTALRAALTSRDASREGGRWHAVSGGTAVVVLGTAGPAGGTGVRAYAERLLDRIRDLSAGRFACVAGIGAGVAGLDRTFESAGQAHLARRAAAGVLGRPVATWAELGPYGILLRIPSEDLTEDALPEELRRLRRIDTGGQLAETVRAYLDHAGNGPAASAALHIHRTTLYYRLGRMRELTGLDLDDGRTRLTLHLGLALTDIIDAADGSTAPPPMSAAGSPASAARRTPKSGAARPATRS
jgi:hypothetical protein